MQLILILKILILMSENQSIYAANKAEAENINNDVEFLFKFKKLKNLINFYKSQTIKKTFLIFKT